MRRFIPLVLLVLIACGSETSPSTTTLATELVTTGSTEPGTPPITVPTDTTAVPPTSDSTIPITTTTLEEGVVVDVAFANGRVEGGGRYQALRGQLVTIRVTSDVAEEVHVHGYDLFLDLEPGVTGELTFVAEIPGVFEVELEGAHLEIIELEVGA